MNPVNMGGAEFVTDKQHLIPAEFNINNAINVSDFSYICQRKQ